MGQLTRRAHTLFDVYLILLLSLLPILFGMEGTARWVLWSLCAIHFFLTILSDTPFGAKVIPFPVHGMIELVVGLLLPVIPWALGFDFLPNERHTFVGLGFGVLVLWWLTDYKFRTGAWNKEMHADTGVDITAESLHH
jgi:hypothetical protein